MRAVQAAKDFQGIANGLAERLADVVCNEVSDLVDTLGSNLSGEVKGCYIGYVKLQAIPLLKTLVSAICSEQPGEPVAFAALLLAEQASAPESCLSDLRALLQDLGARRSGGDRDATVRPPATRRLSGGRGSPSPGRVLHGRRCGSAGSDAGTEEANDPEAPDKENCCKLSADVEAAPKRGGLAVEDDEPVRSASSTVLTRLRNQADASSADKGPKTKATLKRSLGEVIPPVPHDEVIAMLKRVPFMQQFSDDELARISTITELRRFEQDENVIGFGQKSEELHIVLEGSGRIYMPQQAGQIRKGDFVGEEALKLAGSKSSSHITAVHGSMTTLCLTRTRFEELAIRGRARFERRTDGIKAAGERAANQGNGMEVEPGHCAATLHRIIEGYEQTAADKEMIIQAAKHNKVLGEVMGLSDEQCTMIADAVHLVEVPAGEVVFRKGERGTALFIVQAGLLKVHLDQNIDVKLRVGDTFGELALLYDEPRSASIEALMCCRLFVMPRQAFQAVSQISTQRKLAEYAGLLRRVPCLVDAIDTHLFEMLAGVVEETVFTETDELCTAGEDEGTLFLIYEGECAYQEHDGAEHPHVLKKGDWIGEEQLVKNIHATKTVHVTSEHATILLLQESSFRHVIDSGRTLRRSSSTLNQLKRFKGGLKCGEAADAAPKSDHSLDQCDVAGALGEGSFGRVLLLRDKHTHKEYALKCMSKEHLRNEGQDTMVQNERGTMMLLDSDFIVRLYRSYEDSEFLYLMLEPALGGELFDVYTDHDLWGKVDHARFYAACVSLGLSHMHKKRVIWRDLKLENCLIDASGYVKLTDMGIAKVVVGKTYSVCGTVDYFAPETLKQVGHNRAADWWACGVMLFIMIAGRSPFDAPEVSQIYKNIIKGLAKVEFPSTCPQPVELAIKALCKKKPEDRVTMQKGGMTNLKNMKFFEAIDWSALEAMQLEAPFVPGAPDYDKISNRKLSQAIDIKWDELREWGDAPPEAEDEARAEDEEPA